MAALFGGRQCIGKAAESCAAQLTLKSCAKRRCKGGRPIENGNGRQDADKGKYEKNFGCSGQV